MAFNVFGQGAQFPTTGGFNTFPTTFGPSPGLGQSFAPQPPSFGIGQPNVMQMLVGLLQSLTQMSQGWSGLAGGQQGQQGQQSNYGSAGSVGNYGSAGSVGGGYGNYGSAGSASYASSYSPPAQQAPQQGQLAASVAITPPPASASGGAYGG